MILKILKVIIRMSTFPSIYQTPTVQTSTNISLLNTNNKKKQTIFNKTAKKAMKCACIIIKPASMEYWQFRQFQIHTHIFVWKIKSNKFLMFYLNFDVAFLCGIPFNANMIFIFHVNCKMLLDSYSHYFMELSALHYNTWIWSFILKTSKRSEVRGSVSQLSLR